MRPFTFDPRSVRRRSRSIPESRFIRRAAAPARRSDDLAEHAWNANAKTGDVTTTRNVASANRQAVGEKRETARSPRRSRAIAAGKDSRSRYQHGTERAEPLGARTNGSSVLPRGAERDSGYHSKVIPPGPPCAAAGLSACLPAYLPTSGVLHSCPSPHSPSPRYRTRPPGAFTWRTPDSHETSRNRPTVPLNAIRILPRRGTSCSLISQTAFHYSYVYFYRCRLILIPI